MKRNIILLSIIFISTIILLILGGRATARMSGIASRHNTIDQKYADFTNLKTQADSSYTSANNMLTKNLDYGTKNNNPAYFGQDVYNHVNFILQELDIKNESRRLPQASNSQAMKGFNYIEFEIEITCSFEKFGQFVNRLEKSNKIFIIDRFEFSNSMVQGVQKARRSGVFPDKNIKMRIWAINLQRTK